MNKKLKLAIPFAVLAISCGSAVALTGCTDEKETHTHTYTRWAYDDTYHWKECPDDGAIDESSKEEHVFIAGVCDDCGATQTPVSEVKYGTASGQIKLHKLGEYVTDFTGVTIDMGDDDVETAIDTATGTFTIENAVVGRNYTMTISKSGYKSYSTTVTVAEGEDTHLGGTRGCTLEYEVFKIVRWDESGHDLTHVNDEVPYIEWQGPGVSLNVVTQQNTLGDATISVTLKDSQSTNSADQQGPILVFEDGKAAILNLNTDGTPRLQFRPELFSDGNASLGLHSAFTTEWVEFRNVTEEEVAKYNSETGIVLKVVRKGNYIHLYIDDIYHGTATLPEEYADDKMGFGFFAYDVVNGSRWYYEVSETVPDLAVTLTDGTAADAKGSISGIPEDVIDIGTSVVITVNADEGYKISELLVNGKDVTAQMSGNTYNLVVSGNTVVEATFEEITLGSVNVAISGKKFGVSGNALRAGTQVVLSSAGLENITTELEVVDGNVVLAVEELAAGTWTVQIDGYNTAEITVVKNEVYSTAIALEYDLFKIVRWDADGHDLTHVNDEVPYIEWQGPGVSLNVISKQNMLGDATVSITIKDSQSSNSADQQGLILVFEDGKAAILNLNTDGTPRLQFRPELFSDGNESIGLHTAFTTEWVEFPDVTAEEVAKYNSETGIVLKVVRNGNLLHLYIDDAYHGTATLPEEYADDKMGFGFFAYDTIYESRWYFEVSETVTDLSATLTDKTAADAHGSISGIPEEAVDVGTSVVITVNADEGYKLTALIVNGKDVTAKMNGNTYNLIVSGDTEIEATFEEVTAGSVNAAISGNKLGVSGNALTEGTQVVLSSAGLQDVTAELKVVDGNVVLAVEELAAGTWTVQIAGYKTAEITVVKNEVYSTAIALEYNTLKGGVQPWGEFYLDNQNNGTVGATNEMEVILTNDLYTKVSFSIILSGTYSDGTICGGNQGIVFRFDDGNYVCLRMEGRQKVQFAEPDWYMNGSKADGAGWKDLIFFTEGDEYLAAYDAGTLKLTLVRNGCVFYAFLNGEYIGEQTIDAKYEDVGAHAGIYWASTANGARKDWTVDMTEEFSDVTITDATAADAHGTIAISPEATKAGDEIKVTITPDNGYILKTLTVGGKDVASSVKAINGVIGEYTFCTLSDVTVSAEFEAATLGSVNANISATKYGEDTVNLNGTTVTLANDKAKYDITVTDGKIALENVVLGTYTLTAEGYFSVTVEVTEAGYTSDVELVYQLFTSDPAAADLSEISNGKITATGNGGVDLETIEKYTDVTAEAVFTIPDYTNRRYGIAFVFDDGTNFRVDFAVLDGGSSNMLQQTNWGSMMFNWEWVDFPEGYGMTNGNNYTEDEIRNIFMKDGLTYKLEREGATVKLYINGVLMKTYTLPENYASQAARLKFIFDSNGTDGTCSFTFDIAVPQD